MANEKPKVEMKDKNFRCSEEDFKKLFRAKMDIEYEAGDKVSWGQFVMALYEEYSKAHPLKK